MRMLRPLLLLTFLSGAACGDSDPVAFTGSNLQLSTVGGIVFMTQRIDPSVGMEALFVGALAIDEAGCMRLMAPDAPAVVWPRDYRLDAVPGGGLIRDAAGATVGLLGSDFALAGGEVPELHSGMGFTQADRDAATQWCPGTYWIVNGN